MQYHLTLGQTTMEKALWLLLHKRRAFGRGCSIMARGQATFDSEKQKISGRTLLPLSWYGRWQQEGQGTSQPSHSCDPGEPHGGLTVSSPPHFGGGVADGQMKMSCQKDAVWLRQQEQEQEWPHRK